jgi:Bacterial Ig-like domain (group 2)
MLARRCVQGLLLLCLSTAVVGCSNPSGLDSVQVTPATQSVSVGQTVQFKAIGTFGNAMHPSTQDITSTVTWTSTVPTVATVSATGLVTAVAAGTTTITAESSAFNGPVSSSSNLTVTGAGGGAGGGSLLSLTIIPNALAVGNLQATGQFLAIGTFSSAPFTRDLTNSPTLTWISAFPNDFPVSTSTGGNLGATGGVVSAYANGNTVITAEAKSPTDGTLQTATATFACPLVIPNPTANPPTAGSCYPGSEATSLLSTLTIYQEGADTANDWRVTAPSATNVPAVLHCGPGTRADGSGGAAGSVCTATYPALTNGLPTVVTLTATGTNFGGWSVTCAKQGTTPSGAHTCTTFPLTSDETVGVIFD